MAGDRPSTGSGCERTRLRAAAGIAHSPACNELAVTCPACDKLVFIARLRITCVAHLGPAEACCGYVLRARPRGGSGGGTSSRPALLAMHTSVSASAVHVLLRHSTLPAGCELACSETGKRPATGNQQPATSNQQPATSNQRPATSDRQPANSNQQPSTSQTIHVTSLL
jgi:hypothetical protein